MAQECPICHFKLEQSSTLCPNCGAHLSSDLIPSSSAGNLIGNYFRSLIQIITQPKAFFRKMPLTGGWSGPLAFALVTHWLGSATQFLWNGLLGASYQESITETLRKIGRLGGEDIDSLGRNAQWMEVQRGLTQWIWGAGSVITDPFFTLATTLLTSLLIYLGARLFISPKSDARAQTVEFEPVLRVVCYGLSPSIFRLIPFAGGFAASVLSLVITAIGLMEIYRTDALRAGASVLFPKLLVVGAIFAIFASIVFVIMSFMGFVFL